MSDLPDSLREHLFHALLDDRAAAWIRSDGEQRIVELGGALERFGLGDLQRGAAIDEHFEFLHGHQFEPGAHAQTWPRLELGPQCIADVHLLEEGPGCALILLDATEQARRDQRYQQRGNEWSLLLRSWGVAVFECDAQQNFSMLGLAPAWMKALELEERGADLLEQLPFLETFLPDARAAWARSGPNPAWAGMWVEEDQRGREWELEASATVLEDGRRMLIVQSAERRYAERQHILQRARSRVLDLQRLSSELDKKEVLLHCIVHDLKAPLSAIVGGLSLLRSADLSAEQREELLELGLERARFQDSLLEELLHAYRDDIEALQRFETSSSSAPDALLCAQRAIEACRLSLEGEQHELHISSSSPERESYPVVGEASRLVRVYCNLIENALRHSPAGARVEISLQARAEDVLIAVRDRGPGVDEEFAPHLFERFASGGPSSGAVGLGLYFCRRTVETWGGRIGYEARAGGGSEFWFSLPSAR